MLGRLFLSGWRRTSRRGGGTPAVRAPVRPATRWMRVVSMASARVIAGRMVVSRRASIHLPAPGGPSRRRCGQNACITFSFTTASKDANG
jgi:hypothetical protein